MSALGGERAGGLRLIRVVLVALACGIVLNTTGVVVTFFLNADRVDQINRERAANITRNCEDVNSRYDKTVAEVDRILAERLKTAGRAERARLRASRESTVALVNALVPRRDCRALARRQVKNP